MTTPDPSPVALRVLVTIRVLAGLHGLPALLAVLYGGFFAGYDVLDGDTGGWDGLGLALGGVTLAVGAVPLGVAVAAVRSSNLTVVRACGLALGVAGLGLLQWLGEVPPVLVLPSIALIALSSLSLLTSAGEHDEASGPVRLPDER